MPPDHSLSGDETGRAEERCFRLRRQMEIWRIQHDNIERPAGERWQPRVTQNIRRRYGVDIEPRAEGRSTAEEM
jgi:phage terminase large subunit GpA-like protein